jgi:hypothetical protein
MKYELWQPKELTLDEPTSDFFFPESSAQMRRFAEEDGMVCTWTVEADEYNVAMQLYYDHMGWGRYKPMED